MVVVADVQSNSTLSDNIDKAFQYSSNTLLQYLRNINDNRGRTVFVRSRDVVDPVRRQLAMRIEKIVSETSSLTSAQYIPTLLAANTWTNIILLMIKQRLTLRFNDSFFTRDTLNTDDGGTVSVDWFDEASALPDSAPVVIFLHTVSGSSREVINYTSEARRRGWRSCVFNRRGPGSTSWVTRGTPG